MKTNEELLITAYAKVGAAHVGLKLIHDAVRVRPVPPLLITPVLVNLCEATLAVTELERRAQGGDIPKEG